jgi:hypothetical protein
VHAIGEDMTITLDLKPEIEATLLDQAAREGVDAKTLVVRTLEHQYGGGSVSSAGSRDAALLLQISEGPSELTWRRYKELSARRDSESLTLADQDELMSLSEKIELAGVRRIELMAELAKLRGITLRQLSKQLGVPTGSRDDGSSDGQR